MLLACLVAVICGLFATPKAAFADDQAAGSFTLAAINQTGDGYLIEPTQVSYTQGQTLEQALEASGQGIEFSGGFITEVKGADASTSARVYYTGGWRDGVGYAVEASECKALLITLNTATPTLTEDHADLLAQMGSYLTATTNVRNYPKATSAYQAAYQGLVRADGATAGQLYTDLKAAMDEYQSIIDGVTYAVNATVTRGSTALADATATLTDPYGNVTPLVGGQARVVAGTYTLEAATADGLWAAQRTVSVSEASDGQTVAVDLPTTEWFGDLELLDGKGAYKVPVARTGSIASRSLTFHVPDYITQLNCLFAVPTASEAVPANDGRYSAEARYTSLATGQAYVNRLAFDSESHNLDYLLAAGTQGASLTFEIHFQADDDTVQIERCPATVVRTPTLTGLSVKQGSTELLAGFDPFQVADGQHSDTYVIKTTAGTLDVSAMTFGGSGAGSTVTVGGQAAAEGAATQVSIPLGQSTVPVVVTSPSGESTTYTLDVTREDGAQVTITHDADVSVQVLNAAGGVVDPESDADGQAVYRLFEGETYSYISTAKTYYHATNTFMASAGATVRAATPIEDHIVDDLQLARSGVQLDNSGYRAYQRDESQGDDHTFVFDIPDTATTSYVRLVTSAASWIGNNPYFSIDAKWNSSLDGTPRTLPWETTSAGKTQRSWSNSSEKSFVPRPAIFNASDKYDKENGNRRYKTYDLNADGVTYRHNTEGTGAYVSYADKTHLCAQLSNLITKGANGNTAVLSVKSGRSDTEGTVYYQDYTIKANRVCTLANLTTSLNGTNLKLAQTATLSSGTPRSIFSESVLEYSCDVPASATSLDVGIRFQAPLYGRQDDGLVGGYTASIPGGDPAQIGYSATATQVIAAPLDTSKAEAEDVPVTVTNEATGSIATTYVIHVIKHAPIRVGVNVTPADATVSIIDESNNSRVWPDEDGKYLLTDGMSYRWSVGALGYIGQGSADSGSLVASEGMGDLNITLEKAEPNTKLDTSLTSFWPTFRLGEDNLSYVDAPTPTLASQSVLYWSAALGQGFDKAAAGCPILVDGYLYTYGSAAGKPMIFKCDVTTGETVAQNTMVGSSSFSLTPPTYADGMIFTAITNGVEAFDAKTLESLWVYTDPLGGQPNCPVTYHDGYVYTGFWNAYTGKYANFVCLSATDEHPDKPGHEMQIVDGREKGVVTDAKQALWTHTTEAGYYWAGALARDNYVLMGADDGLAESSDPNGTGVLYSFDARTGRVIDTLKGTDDMPFTGDVRTQISYDEQTGYYYFMTKNGYLNRMKVNDDGTFVPGSYARLDLSQSTPIGMGMCTTTPAIYNGRAYVGVSGASQFGDYSGHCLAVVDLASFSVAYTVETKGYVQATPLISTHYVNGTADGDGYAYVYAIENCQPGEMRIIRDKPGMTAPDEWSLQDEDCTPATARPGTSGGVRKLARTLFAPKGSEAQYAICSPICDEDGFIYFKNDSGRMMCLGPTMTSLEITQQPDRTSYAQGEVFDPTGMKVVAHYSNGATRDVSKYVSYNTAPLTTRDRSVTIRFEHTKYQNTSDYTKTSYQAPVDYQAPTASIDVFVGDKEAPTITTGALPAGYAGSALSPATHYSATLAASAYPAVTSWQVVSGALPKGLSLDAATGTISGTPSEAGSFTFAVTATNDNGTSEPRELTIEVQKPPTITFPVADADLTVTGSVGSGFVRPYQLAASGYPQPTWQVYLGALPDGLVLDPATGTISGTPTKAGTYAVAFMASNGVWPQAITQQVTFEISETARLAVTTDSLPSAQVDQEYAAQLESNATLGATWSIVGGALPEGLALDPDTGTITGASATAGTYDVTFAVSTTWGGTASRQLRLIVGQVPAFETTSLPDATAGQAYSATVTATGYPAPAITAAGLPAGLALVDNGDGTATISGMPAAAGGFQVAVTAGNGVGEVASAELDLTVAAAPAPQPGDSRVERLAGSADSGSAGTAAAIASRAFEGEGCDTVVIARNDNYMDALAGSGLAGALDAPVLLTDSASLSPAAAEEIRSLGATRAVVLGGTSAVSDQVVSDLAALGLSVDRVAGSDVYGTSLAINQALAEMEGADASQAVVVNPTSFADAVSISGWAYRNRVPVMLQTWGDTAAERGFDEDGTALLAGRHLIVCGGKGAVSDDSVSAIDPAFERLGGDTIYATSLAIANWELGHGMSASDVTVASAIPDYRGVDALAASALAGRAGGVTLLAQSNPAFNWHDGGATALGFITAHASDIEQVHVLGGEVASTPALYSAIRQALGEGEGAE